MKITGMMEEIRMCLMGSVTMLEVRRTMEDKLLHKLEASQWTIQTLNTTSRPGSSPLSFIIHFDVGGRIDILGRHRCLSS